MRLARAPDESYRPAGHARLTCYRLTVRLATAFVARFAAGL